MFAGLTFDGILEVFPKYLGSIGHQRQLLKAPTQAGTAAQL